MLKEKTPSSSSEGIPAITEHAEVLDSKTLKANIRVSPEEYTELDDKWDGNLMHQRKLEYLTIAQLRLLKLDIEECYGKGNFKNHIFEEIVNFLNNYEEIIESKYSKEAQKKDTSKWSDSLLGMELNYKDAVLTQEEGYAQS